MPRPSAPASSASILRRFDFALEHDTDNGFVSGVKQLAARDMA